MAQSRLSPLSACAVHAPPLPASALLYLGRSFPGVSRAASSEVLKMSSTLSPLTSYRPEPTCPGDLWLPDPLCALLLLPVLPQLLPLSSCPLGCLHHHAPVLSLGPRFRPPGPAARSPPAPSILGSHLGRGVTSCTDWGHCKFMGSGCRGTCSAAWQSFYLSLVSCFSHYPWQLF